MKAMEGKMIVFRFPLIFYIAVTIEYCFFKYRPLRNALKL